MYCFTAGIFTSAFLENCKQCNANTQYHEQAIFISLFTQLFKYFDCFITIFKLSIGFEGFKGYGKSKVIFYMSMFTFLINANFLLFKQCKSFLLL